MILATGERVARAGSTSGRPTGQLALVFQEAFTVVARLRTSRQVAADAGAFRRHVKQLLAAADRDARAAGYRLEYVRQAVYAYVAFLDESVLNSPQPMFAGWTRQPLQEEVFGDHRAGETFFVNLRKLLGEPDSPQLADVLEVHLLCLMLGFRGRYGSSEGELQNLIASTRDKIGRIRGEAGLLAPSWAPPEGEDPPPVRDPWIRRLAWAGAGTVGIAAVLVLVYRVLLAPGVREARALAEQILTMAG